ncbi:unnamed protein product, partial [Laminaria digitata]
RHIYNRSGEPWTVRASGTLKVLYYEGSSYVGEGDGYTEWIVGDDSSLQVDYATQYVNDNSVDILSGFGSWTLIDKNNKYVKYDWGVKWYDVFGFSPYVEHDGATNLMNLNNPADGDIDIWGPTF